MTGDAPPDDPLRDWVADPRVALRRAGWTFGLGLLVLVAALVAAGSLGAEGAEGLWERLRWPPLILAWVLVTNAWLMVGLRWRELMPAGVWPSAVGLTSIQCAGTLLNYALPGPVGEVGSAWLAHRRYGVPLADSLASVLAGRLLGLVTASLLAVGSWAAFAMPVPDGFRAPVGIVAVALGVGGCAGIAVALRPDLLQEVVSRALRRLEGPGFVGRAIASLDRVFSSLTQAAHAVTRRGPRAWMRATGWSLVGHASFASGLAVAAWSLGASPSLPGVLFTYTAVTSGLIVLYAAPGSQVAWDAMLVALLVGAAGLGVADALAVAFLLRLQQLSVLVLGALALAWVRVPAA